MPHYFCSGNKRWNQQIMKKNRHWSTKLTTENNKNRIKLKDEIINEEFKKLNIEFSVVHIGNASGNAVCVYWRHYAYVLSDELGLNNGNSTTRRCVKEI